MTIREVNSLASRQASERYEMQHKAMRRFQDHWRLIGHYFGNPVYPELPNSISLRLGRQEGSAYFPNVKLVLARRVS